MAHNNTPIINSVLHADWDLPSVALPQLTNPDYVLTEDFESVKDTSIFDKDAYTTWGATDPTDNTNKVLEGRYSEGIQSDNSAWSEQEINLPINAVQIVTKFREYIPSTYTSADAYNHKTVGFWSGDYSVTDSNITVSSECWPVNNGGKPSIYAGFDGTNFGHIMHNEDNLLWEPNDGNWHDICAVLELAQAPGQYGRYRIYRDGVLLIDSNQTSDMETSWNGYTSQEVIGYSTRGNFIDTVRLFGWCNPRVSGTDAFSVPMSFLYDNLELTANATFKPIIEP